MHEEPWGTKPQDTSIVADPAPEAALSPIRPTFGPDPDPHIPRVIGLDYRHTREIQSLVASHWNLKRAVLLGPRRVRSVCRPRMMAMGLCRSMTPLSYPQIGFAFGGRDHTTVIHAVRRFREWLMHEDPQAQETARFVYANFTGPLPLIDDEDAFMQRCLADPTQRS